MIYDVNFSRGQLGNGSLLAVEHPTLLELLDGLFVIDIDAGGWHSVAVTTCNSLYSWGWNNFGQLGFRSDKSEFERFYNNVFADSNSCYFVLDTKADDGDSYISVLPEPRLVEWPNDAEVAVKQVACGNAHTIVLSGKEYCLGTKFSKFSIMRLLC